jgi:uncharacterized membrane protein YhaH (DUF805 family)
MKWFLIVLKKYAVFTGRARRKELWMFTLFCVIFWILLMILDKVLGTTFNLDKQGIGNVLFSIFVGEGWFDAIFGLAIIIPSWAVCWRRLHDIGKSGWWNLLFFVPIIGWIILLVWHCTDSQVGENTYGGNPKEIIE